MDKKCAEESVFGLLGHIGHMTRENAKWIFDEYDLKPWQAGILFVLAPGDGMSQRELAEKMKLTPPTITSSIRKMEELGYIERRMDEKDQRVMRLYMTEKSRNYTQHVQKATDQLNDVMLRNFSIEEKLLLKRLLLQMKKNLREEKETHEKQVREKNR